VGGRHACSGSCSSGVLCACARARACMCARARACMCTCACTCAHAVCSASMHGIEAQAAQGRCRCMGAVGGGDCNCTRMPGRRHLHKPICTGTSGKAARVGAERQSPVRVIAALRPRNALRCPNRPGAYVKPQARALHTKALLSKSSTSAMTAVGCPRTPRPPPNP